MNAIIPEIDRRSSVPAVFTPVRPEEFFFLWEDRLDRAGDPGGVDVMLPGDVLTGNVAAPRAATQGEREGHAVDVVARVGVALGLAHHDARDARFQPKRDHPLIPGRVDAAGMPAPAVGSDVVDVSNGLIESLEFPQGNDG